MRLGWMILAVVMVGVGLRVAPLLTNNFYFTVDQGRDAVYVREILEHGRIFTKGPETTIRSIYTLPGWYYFLAVGYWLTGGHPVGGVVMTMVLNMATLAGVMWWVGKRWGKPAVIGVGVVLSGSWAFYDTSRWAFNPFPLVALAVAMFVILYEKKWWGGIFIIFLAANVNLAGAAVLAGWWLPPLAAIGMIKAGGQQFWVVGQEIWRIFTYATVPQSIVLSLGLWIWLGWTRRKSRLIKITMLLVAVAWGILGAAKVYRDWYLVFLPVILQIVLGVELTKKKPIRIINIIIIIIVILGQGGQFGQRYWQYLNPQSDASILANQMKIVDWIYQQSQREGFAAYVYTDTFFDYPYQYLWWWRGLKKYGYLPCEYANYPGSIKAEYVPGWERYSQSAQDCPRWRYLIIESPSNGETNGNWIEDYRATTKLVDKLQFGKVIVEKREVTDEYRERYNMGVLWRDYRENEMGVTVPEEWELEKLKNELRFKNRDETIKMSMKRVGKGCEEWSEGVDYHQLINGQVNDYVVEMWTRGVMKRAEGVVERILDSAKIYEDEGTVRLKKC